MLENVTIFSIMLGSTFEGLYEKQRQVSLHVTARRVICQATHKQHLLNRDTREDLSQLIKSSGRVRLQMDSWSWRSYFAVCLVKQPGSVRTAGLH